MVEAAPRTDSSSTIDHFAEDEQRKAAQALLREEARLHAIADALPALVAHVDATQRYRFVNAAYERWFGRPPAEIVGRHLEDVLGSEAYAMIQPLVERALCGTPVSFDGEIPYRAGGVRCVEANYVPQRAADGSVEGFVSLVTDVTERRILERFRSASSTRAERLLKVTAAIADAVSGAQVFEALVDRVAEAVGASSAGLWLVDDDDRVARLARAVGYSEAGERELAQLPLDAQTSVPVVDAIRTGAPLWISSQAELLRQYPQLSALVSSDRSYRVSCLPLVTHGRVLGALGLTIEEAVEADQGERDFLLLIARYASQAVARLRLFDAERRSRADAGAAAARLGVLSRASRAFVETAPDLDSRARGVVRELGAALASCVGLSLLGSDGRLHTSAVYHPVARASELLDQLGRSAPLQLGEGITGSVAASGKSVLLAASDLQAMQALAAPAYRPFLERHPIYAMICAPLRARGQIIGTVTATRVNQGETYTQDDLGLLEELAERAAGAIENSQLYQENLDGRARAEHLYKFAQAAVAAERVEQVFGAALTAIKAALGTERASILTFDGQGVMRFRAFENLSEDYRRAVDGHSPWARDAAAPAPLLVTDAANDPLMAPYAPLFRREGIGSLAFIPLLAGGRLVGKFMVYHAGPHSFPRHEVETAAALANHLASVITRFEAVARLEDIIRYNELFAGVLAHDLRNPLGAIMTAAQILLMRSEGKGEGRDSDSAKPLSRIVTSGQRMTRMIDQLLDLTRARSSLGIQIQARDTNLHDLCAQAIGELELANPDWVIQQASSGDLCGEWDPDRLLQVISNLVANAGHHGRPGSPIAVELDGSGNDLVRFAIHNRGAIAEAMLPHVFDPLRSARHGHGHSGLGLGLYIVKEIVRAHAGQVEVASSEPAGTTFMVELPRSCRGRTAAG
jgi:PAS domain S-box-containing protein